MGIWRESMIIFVLPHLLIIPHLRLDEKTLSMKSLTIHPLLTLQPLFRISFFAPQFDLLYWHNPIQLICNPNSILLKDQHFWQSPDLFQMLTTTILQWYPF